MQKRNRESREYVQKVIRWIKIAKMINTFNHINIICNEIDAKLKRDLEKSSKNTTIDDYLQFLNDCKNIWWFFAKRNLKYSDYSSNLSQKTNEQF
jgi:hypothetical protein